MVPNLTCAHNIVQSSFLHTHRHSHGVNLTFADTLTCSYRGSDGRHQHSSHRSSLQGQTDTTVPETVHIFKKLFKKIFQRWDNSLTHREFIGVALMQALLNPTPFQSQRSCSEYIIQMVKVMLFCLIYTFLAQSISSVDY